MAAFRLAFTSGPISLAAATPTTIIQLVAPTNQRVELVRYSVSFDGTSSISQPAQIRILRQTTAGTFTAASNTPRICQKGLTETPQTNYQIGATGEPTAGDELRNRSIPTFMGFYEDELDPEEIVIQGGGRLGFEVTAAATVNVRIDGEFKE